MEKRLILAIALSIFIIVGFQYFFVKPSPQLSTPQQEQQKVATSKESSSYDKAPASFADAAAIIPVDEKTTKIETDHFSIIFSNIGGSIKEIRLKDFKERKSADPMVLSAMEAANEYLFAISSLVDPVRLDSAEYGVDERGEEIKYSTKTNNFEVVKTYKIEKNKNIIELKLNVRNISNSAKKVEYRIVGGAGVDEKSNDDKRFVDVTGKINEKKIGYKNTKDEKIINMGDVSWTALKNKFFVLVLKPFTRTNSQFYYKNRKNELVMGVEAEGKVLQPGEALEHKYVMYAGPYQYDLLKKQGYGLEESVDYGFFGGISKFLIAVLGFFYKLFHSWGVAIILLSIFLNILLFPLSMKSFKSMQKMQELHPHMEKLKVQYKNDPSKLNKEVMELYKKYKINPFGGCLPMLLQMPIFIALYQALMRSVELRGDKFLWINDLSAPDAVGLPITLPIIGNSINILPLIMIAAMVVQQKISTKTMGSAVTDEQKQQQKMMLVIMPIMFGFIFYNMPSGLVLYWVINTSLTIVEQAYAFKKD